MVGTCEACREHISVTVKRIKCTLCNSMYHSECVGFTGDSTSARTQWKCPKCTAATRKGGDNSNTPVRTEKSAKITRTAGISESADPTTSECSDADVPPALFSRFEHILDVKLRSIKDEIVEELKTTVFMELKHEITALSSEFSQLQASYNNLHHENDKLKNDLLSLQERVDASEEQVLELRSQIGRQQQQARINNLEIVGLPQTSSDSPTDIVLKIAAYAGVELRHEDIESAHRVQPQNAVAGRPKPIVVKLRERMCKDKLLSGLKRKKGICTKDIGIDGLEKKFFVNEHLTPENKQLFNKTKLFAREKAFKFVWIRNCNIFLRKNEESPAINIRFEKDLVKIK